MLARPRRNRKSKVVRALVRETTLSVAHLVQPLFVHEHEAKESIESLPGLYRHTSETCLDEIQRCMELGITSFILFPKLSKKTPDGAECYNPEGLIPNLIRSIKAKFPDCVLFSDIALDPYNSDGHDGLVRQNEIVNDETVEVLCKQALAHAAAGVDVVAPSDMMDGRIEAIRRALDANGHTNVSIMSYSIKYASSFYGPFRAALDSEPTNALDKTSYQMDPANVKEGRRELQLDAQEGADILLVKPAMAYLDVVRMASEEASLPIAAYQVSGYYAMVKAAGERGWIDEPSIVWESLLSMRRAGASLLLTYFARDVAEKLSVESGGPLKRERVRPSI